MKHPAGGLAWSLAVVMAFLFTSCNNGHQLPSKEAIIAINLKKGGHYILQRR